MSFLYQGEEGEETAPKNQASTSYSWRVKLSHEKKNYYNRDYYPYITVVESTIYPKQPGFCSLVNWDSGVAYYIRNLTDLKSPESETPWHLTICGHVNIATASWWLKSLACTHWM